MSTQPFAEKGQPAALFSGDDLDMLLKLQEAVFDLAEQTGRRLVVEVWDRPDHRPVAWVEVHPEDSETTTRFVREIHDHDDD